MKQALSILVVLSVVAAGVVPAMAVAGSASLDATAEQAQTTTAEPIAPGAVLSGSIGAQQAELQGAVEQRAFALKIAAGGGNETRARLLATEQRALENRSQHLEQRLQEMQRAHQNGTISTARYQGEVTGLVAQTRTLEQYANLTERTARNIPADILEQQGVDVQALAQMQERARTMAGPEAAAMAQRIAGPSTGHSYGPPQHAPGGPSHGDGMNRPDGSTRTPMMGANTTDDRTTSPTDIAGGTTTDR
ncbi:hypothetical protein HTSR_1050 [Halodesulfurarchaeum formicicum]|uniref:Uncharacterized protein n=1 Tax=Halodesulfurarchaeum formicicum TaxID=1873524 RepID=A0A1D8S4F8_9EURY|nr:hypothetical protein [Halodesulfurarchaeum formicicum]AOW80232.1 hypothetical protein HTSR_1050 [Halodesulfurarchaeum formicicum]APE95533.1 hypothetical protein HSR6_1083 [Halodesulfurarchaeum formicicum]